MPEPRKHRKTTTRLLRRKDGKIDGRSQRRTGRDIFMGIWVTLAFRKLAQELAATERRVLIAYTVKDRTPGRSAWRRIGVAFPHDRGAGLTDALPIDGRIVLVETKADPASVNLRDPPSKPPRPSS